MATIRDLIKQLQEEPDHDRFVSFQYYLPEDFDHILEADFSPDEKAEMFKAVVDCNDYLWNDAYENLEQALADKVRELEEDEF